MYEHNYHIHKNNDDVIIVDFMPITDNTTNNYNRLHGSKPRRYIQEIKAIQKMMRKDAKKWKQKK